MKQDIGGDDPTSGEEVKSSVNSKEPSKSIVTEGYSENIISYWPPHHNHDAEVHADIASCCVLFSAIAVLFD